MNAQTNTNVSADDDWIRTCIANILLYGVSLAVIVVLFGASIYLWRHGQESFAYGKNLSSEPILTNLPDIFAAVLALKGRGIIQLGLMILVATPIARVAFSVFAFIRQKDHVYTLITAVVLAVLCYSLLGG